MGYRDGGRRWGIGIVRALGYRDGERRWGIGMVGEGEV